MKREKDSRLKHHMFVCTNQKPNGPCCYSKGGKELRDSLKTSLRDRGLWGEYKVSASGCLGGCESGITCVIYPQGIWLKEVTLDGKELLLNTLLEDM